MNIQLLHGDCLQKLKELPDNSVDSVVTDPPYGLGFMNKEWDSPNKLKKNLEHHKQKVKDRDNGSISPLPFERYGGRKEGLWFQQWCEEWGKECLRVLKPGGYLLSFSAPRMYHRMTSGLEDAGFQIRDQIMWLFGSGFPKSQNMGNGIGTGLKPAHEPIVVCRKPFNGTCKNNIKEWGTGGYNIDDCRIPYQDDKPHSVSTEREGGNSWNKDYHRTEDWEPNNTGRWPANLILDEEAAELLDEQSGISGTGKKKIGKDRRGFFHEQNQIFSGGTKTSQRIEDYGDKGGASRFFYIPKASKKDRGNDNNHPTVKPTELMYYLIKLVTPKGGVVLDPFMGSGSTGKAAVRGEYSFIGIEKEEEYIKISQARIDHEYNIKSN